MKENVEQIIDLYVNTLTTKYHKDIESIYLVGSFANDSYIDSKYSNINVVTILKDSAKNNMRDKIINRITVIQNKVKNIYITKNVYYLKELKREFNTNINDISDYNLLVYVTDTITRIKDHGRLLFGNDLIHILDSPNREEVIIFDKIRKELNEDNKKYQKMIESPSLFEACRLIIEDAARHYYYATGKFCYNYNLLDEVIKEAIPNYMFHNLLKKTISLKKRDYYLEDKDKETEFLVEYFRFINFVLDNDVDNVPLEYRS